MSVGSMDTSTFELLADQISTCARTLSLYCNQNGHSPRPFDSISPVSSLATTSSQELSKISKARKTMLEAAFEIQQLVTDADEFLLRQAIQVSSRIENFNCCLSFSLIMSLMTF